MKKNKTYSNVLYTNSAVTVDDIVSNKIENIHRQLYMGALESLYKTNYSEEPTFNDFLNNYIICEVKKFNYNEPSVINIRKKTEGNIDIIDLTPYWPVYNFINKPDNQIIVKDYNYKYDELVNIDYARGEISLFNKLLQIKRQADISSLKKNTKISDILSSKNTFYKLLKNGNK